MPRKFSEKVFTMKKVVVLGAGYGGLRAVENLVNHPHLEIMLIDQHPYHYLQTEAYGYIAGRFDLHDVAIDLTNWALGFRTPVTFVQEHIHTIDFDTHLLLGDNGTYTYDYLIIAVGAETNFYSFIPGLRENSYGVKKLQRAFNFRTAFEKLLYEKIEAPQSVHGEYNIAIGGAGLSGVEIAAEMADVIKKHAKSIGASTREIKIYLIDASSTILPGMSSYIIENTQKRLQELGIIIMTDAFIESVAPHEITFKDGRKLEFFFMIFTGGITVPQLSYSHQPQSNRIGQFITDPFLHVNGRENVFAIGDCVEIRDAKGALLPPTAQTAERSAEYVAKALAAHMGKRRIKPFNASIQGLFVALGGTYAVGELFSIIKVRGTTAYWLKKLITTIYAAGLKLRVNTGFKIRSAIPKR